MSSQLLRAAGALVLAAVVTTSARGQDVVIVADTAASRHVGQRVTVEGLVANVKVSAHRHTTFLNFRFPYPDHSFSAWIADTLATRFPAPAALERRRVRVTGVVWMQDGKWPAVTLERPEDLTIVEDAPR